MFIKKLEFDVLNLTGWQEGEEKSLQPAKSEIDFFAKIKEKKEKLKKRKISY